MADTVLVLGSGPIRIGQGIEFDYSCVHCVWALRQAGYRALIINNNPETVSTDFDTGDGLFFEPVTFDDVMKIVRQEKPIGVVCQFGGQTAINLAERLHGAGVQVLGTSHSAIAAAEDRDQFDQLLSELKVPKPNGKAVRSLAEARKIAKKVGYPVLVRPSFVLGGRAMEIVYDEGQLAGFYAEAEAANPDQPVLVDKYLHGKEAEVDVISDGVDTLVPGIMEHIERAGVHSGDSMAVYPAVTLSADAQTQMVVYACRIAKKLGIKGLMNIQFVVQDGVAYVLEVNPRASRTVPYLSKVTGVPMVQLATRCMMGEKLSDMGYTSGLWTLEKDKNSDQNITISVSDIETWKPGSSEPLEIPATPLYAVKAPVFSFQKLRKVEPSLGPEMKSTGEVLGLDHSYEAALYKAMVGSGITFKASGFVILSVNDQDKPMAVEIARKLVSKGYLLASTGGTHDALEAAGIRSRRVNKIQEGSPNLLELIIGGEASLMINTPSIQKEATDEALQIRRACIETGVACVTSIDTAAALARALDHFADPDATSCKPYLEYLGGAKMLS